ncbi:MAG: DUF3592 domain-containing protein [Candidatus Thiodiazotropha sp.]
MYKILLASLMIAIGLLVVGIKLYQEKDYFELQCFGEKVPGNILRAVPAGEKVVSHSRYSMNLPNHVPVYDLMVQFDTQRGRYESTTRLTYYQINDHLGGIFQIKPITGLEVEVIYLPDDPAINRANWPLTWNDFWYVVIGGFLLWVGGIVLLFVVRPLHGRVSQKA